MSSTNNENRFNIKLVFGPRITIKRPSKGETLVLNIKCVTKTKIQIKIMKFVANFEKSVLRSHESQFSVFVSLYMTFP